MGYDDKFYFGQAKIINETSSPIEVDGKTVQPNQFVMVKGTEVYNINGSDVYANYGDCIRIGE